MKKLLLNSTILGCVLLAPSLVWAAEATATATAAADAAAPPLEAAVGEIVVTARRVQEKIEDVPISMSVVDAKALAQTGAYSLDDLQRQVPSMVSFQANPRNTSVSIRGLGVTAAQDGLDTSVGVYVDGVYLGRPGMALEDLIDIQQFEMLRGPQGTLFGRNSSAGVLNITTKAPSFTPSISAEVSGGSYNYNQDRVTITGPILDNSLAFRLTAYSTTRGGITKNVAGGDPTNSIGRAGGRAQLLYQPDPNLSVRVIGEYAREDDSGAAPVLVAILPDSLGATIKNTKIAMAQTGWTPVSYANATAANRPVHHITNNYGLSVEADYHLPSVNFTSISAWREWTWFSRDDYDYSPLDILAYNGADTVDHQYSQEFRMYSNPGRLTWQTGIYLYHQLLDDDYKLNTFGSQAGTFLTNYARITNPAAAATVISNGAQYLDAIKTTADSAAVFGQGNYEIVKGLTLTLGGRYTSDWRHGISTSGSAGTIPAARAAPFAYNLGISGSNLSGLATLAYKPTSALMFYATASNGYKSAGLSLNAAGLTNAQVIVNPELATSYELGAKFVFLQGKLVVNADAYTTKINGLQASYTPPDGSKSYLTNAGTAQSRGFEFDANWMPLPGLNLSANTGFNEATYLNYKGAPCPVGTAGICNLTGRPVYLAPKWTAAATARYEFDYGPNARPYLQAQYSYVSSTYGTLDDSPYALMAPHGLLNLRVGSTFSQGKYDVTLWINNVGDVQYYGTRQIASAPGAGAYAVSAVPGNPRMVGATAKVLF